MKRMFFALLLLGVSSSSYARENSFSRRMTLAVAQGFTEGIVSGITEHMIKEMGPIHLSARQKLLGAGLAIVTLGFLYHHSQTSSEESYDEKAL